LSSKQIFPGIHQIPLGFVNAYLIEGDGLTVIDTGIGGSEEKILAAVEEGGWKAEDVRQILITHYHMDHIGGLAALKAATGAEAYMHRADGDLVREGKSRPADPAPGLLYKILYRLVIPQGESAEVDPIEVEHDIEDGQVLDFANGLKAIHTPGHTAGHLVFLHPDHGGVLFMGDAVTRWFGLGYPPLFEDFKLGLQSIKAIGDLLFETACFAHGKPLMGNAAESIRRKWGT